MNKTIGFTMIMMLANLSLAATVTRTIGNVVAEERVFEVSLAQCEATFKVGPYSSICSFKDSSLTAVAAEQKVGGSKGFSMRIPTGGRDSGIQISFDTDLTGWYMVFEKSNDANSRGLTFSEAQTYVSEVVAKIQGKASSIVYTIK